MTRNGTADEYHPDYDPETGTYHVTHDWDGDDTLGITVVRAVGAILPGGVDELDDVLFDAIDPDALDRLFDPGSRRPQTPATGRNSRSAGVWFTFADHHVVVYGSGDIEIHPPDADDDDLPG